MCVLVCACARVDIFHPHTLFLFVSPVALLMSCNIKLAVSESSRLSVSLVVPACRAAHLCLLDKTCSTLPRENTLSPSFTLLHSSLFSSFCLSHSLFFCQYCFYFLKPSQHFFPVSLPAVQSSLFFLAPLSSFLLSLLSLCPFLFRIIFSDLFVSPSV